MIKQVAVAYYTPEDIEAIRQAESPQRINQIKKDVFLRMPPPLNLVVGLEKSEVKAMIGWLKARGGVSAPNYLPLLRRFEEILRKGYSKRELSKSQREEMRTNIVNGFYLQILKNFKGVKLWLMPNFRSCDICRRVREYANENGIEIRHISDFNVRLAERLAARNNSKKIVADRL